MIRLLVSVLALITSLDPATKPDSVSPDNQKRSTELMTDGWALWQKQQYDDAAEKFQQSVELDPNNANSWNGLGWAKFNGGETAHAVEAFKKCVEIAPNHPAGLNGLGQIALAQGKLDEAEKWFLKASPVASAAWYGLARVYLLQGKWDDAKKWIKKILDSDDVQQKEFVEQMMEAAKNKEIPDSLRPMIAPQLESPAQKLVGEAMKTWQKGNIAEAKKMLDEALEQAPEDATVHDAVGWFKINGERNPGEAEAHFQKALELVPGDISAETGMASVLKMQGKIDEAIAMWKKVVEKYPQAMNAAYSLADAYMEKSEFDKAVPLLENLAKDWPQNQAIKDALEKARDGAKK